MKIKIYQVDAFTNNVFQGNPAAVCPLEKWPTDETLQSIALENNLSETAFFISTDNGYHIRWFTPITEVDLCGHATLATSYVIWEQLKDRTDIIRFHSKSGELSVFKKSDRYCLDFPVSTASQINYPEILKKALGANPLEVLLAEDCIVVLESEEEVAALSPDFSLLSQYEARGILVTAKGKDCDVVSRCFFPRLGIPEDPVTGSAHCTLVPYWAKIIGKNSLFCKQISSRGGELWCELLGDRVQISGNCALYLKGEIEI